MIYICAALLLAGAGLTVFAWWRQGLRSRAVERLFVGNAALVDEPVVERAPRVIVRAWWLAFVAAPLLYAGLAFGLRWPWTYAVVLGVLAGLLVWQLDVLIHAWRLLRIEQQLADAIDLMVAAVKAGSTLQSAMESALGETRRPLQPQLEELLGRIRLGDDPVEAFTALSDRIPLETFRIFSLTLAVNWEVGGRLSQTLANVGRTIRDRIEMTRRVNAVTLQSRLSIVSILVVTYFIAALMWRNDPERMAGFLASVVGQSLTCTAMVLQGVGILWINRLSKPRF
jgi:tight adherence protein B